MGFRITSWNVNGIRNPFGYQPWRDQRTFEAMFEILEADIVVMQEVKIQQKDLGDDIVLVPGWDVYFSLPRHKKGYSGVAIYTRNATCAPIRAEEGVTGVLCAPNSTTRFRDLPQDRQIGGYPAPGQLSSDIDELTLDSEGRCVILEFPAFVLLGVYSPANRDMSRDDFRVGFFDALDVRVRNLISQGKQVILTGDLNIIRSQLDSTNVVETLRKEGLALDDWMTMPTRRLFNQLIFDGNVKGHRDQGREQPVLWDLCRVFHPGREGMNTCWDTKRNTRPANNGSRIDYVLCSDAIKQWFTFADVQQGLMGSDHCPVFADLADTVHATGVEVPLLKLLNPSDMFLDTTRLRQWQKRDLLPLSAKLLPGFDRRQNIRDLFNKKVVSRPSSQVPSTVQDQDRSACEEALENELFTLDDEASMPRVLSTTPDTGATFNASFDANTANVVERHKALPTKRTATTSQRPDRSQKRTKASTDRQNTKSRTTPGQTTLRGFFKSASNSTKSSNHLGQGSQITASPIISTKDEATEATSTIADDNPNEDLSSTPSRVPLSSKEAGKVFDPIQTKESWSKLLGKRVVPRCEHDEPCISLVTKKPGINCGRTFYICPRPLGPSGEKEKDSEWRCGTFIWSSEWNGPSST